MAFVTAIRKGSIVIASGSASNTATITSVNTSYAFVLHGGTYSTAGADGPDQFCNVVLTNGTTVTATRGDTAGDLTVQYTVIELDSSAIVSIQSGSVTLDDAAEVSGTAAISSITTAQSILIWQGMVGVGGGSIESNYLMGFTLTDSTTVTGLRGTATTGTNDVTGYFTVVTLDSAVVDSIQHRTINYSNVSTNDTITTIDPDRSWLVFGGFTSTSTSDPNCYAQAQITSATNVQVTASTTGSAGTLYATVFEMNADYIESVERNSINVDNAVTSNTATITSVDTSVSFVNYCGFITQGDDPGEACLALELTNATTVTARKGTTGSSSTDDGDIVFEVIQLGTGPVGGGGFQAAWAANSNKLIGAGVAA